MDTAIPKDAFDAEYAKLIKAVSFVRKLPLKTSYVGSDVRKTAKSQTNKANEKLDLLREYGLVLGNNDAFMVYRDVINQPFSVFRLLLPSLLAIRRARWFGRNYDETDIEFVRKNMPPGSMITLDYRAAEFTGYQTPRVLYVYLDSVDQFAGMLMSNGFLEGKRDPSMLVALLPKIGSFENETERVFFDCVASGGRDFMDAIAMATLHGHEIRCGDVVFPDWATEKVSEDMPCRQ